jgi:rRNA maturation RNase YbeY
MPVVRFNYADVPPLKIKSKSAIKKTVVQIFLLETRELERINYIYCSDKFLLQINNSYLNHDYLTDIITFDLSEATGTIGEVYISVDRVRENAVYQNTSFLEELARVVFHGALHLCGYRDKKKSEITIMRQKEEYYLHLFDTHKLKK